MQFKVTIFINSPISGTEVTVGKAATLFLGDLVLLLSWLLFHLPESSPGIVGRTLTALLALLGPQVLPLTPSAGTKKCDDNFNDRDKF